ncbi:uncharacterized protein [Littorina saxatilis]|uniref:uncharacterized protein isoform X2 n=1 Tax=Littorina saxatilis TaxID=31220 RepID=UPI0038B68F4A
MSDDILAASTDLLALFLSEMELALRSARHHHDFCNVEELLHALRRVAKLDSNKAVLRQTGAQVVVKRVLTEGSDREKLQAVLVLWELAFDSDSGHAVQRSRDRMMSEWLQKRDNLMQILRVGPVEMVLNELNAVHAQGQGQRNATPIYNIGQLLDVVLQLIMQDDVNARDFVDRGLLNVLNTFVKCGRQEEEEKDCIHLILRTLADGKHVVSFEQTHIYLHVISEMAKTETVNRSREQSEASGHCTGQPGVTLSTGQGLATVSKQGGGGGAARGSEPLCT